MKPVALSIRNENMQGDRIFDLLPDGPVDQAPYTPWRLVRDQARTHGFELMTADRVWDRGIDPRTVKIISYDWPPATDALVAAGARPSILTTLEPPVIAWQLYTYLRRISARFAHAFLFGGAGPRVAPGCTFHQLYFPQVRDPRAVAWPAWSERRFLVSISANKAMVRSLRRWFDRPRAVSLKRELASRMYPPVGRDLYLERLRAVENFAGRADFDLFGMGWERQHPAVPARLHRAVQRVYRGPSSEKLVTLARYRFALCFENSRFPGYVSEKIFDCFFTGTVPVYLGAPDIERYVPRECFIDMQAFSSYGELELFLDSLDEASARRYVEAAAEFVRSPRYECFTQQHFAREMVDALCSLPD
jgi:hypothetical protein